MWNDYTPHAALYTAVLRPSDYARWTQPFTPTPNQGHSMRDSIRHFMAEFIGTFALVFIGGGAIMASDLAKNPAGITQIALAHGLILALMVTATMRVSGHLNPAVTIGFLVTRGDQISFIPTRTSKGLSAVFEKVPDLMEKMMDKKKTEKATATN